MSIAQFIPVIPPTTQKLKKHKSGEVSITLTFPTEEEADAWTKFFKRVQGWAPQEET